MTLATTNKKSNALPSIFDDFLTHQFLDIPSFSFFENQKGALIPNANLIENNQNFEIEIAAPGLHNKDFKAEIKNGILNISAEKEEQSKEEDKNYRKREFSFRSFSRSFVLPENIATDKIDAQYKNGILRLTLPKKNNTTVSVAQKIEIV